jgi:hypothetical protein
VIITKSCLTLRSKISTTSLAEMDFATRVASSWQGYQLTSMRNEHDSCRFPSLDLAVFATSVHDFLFINHAECPHEILTMGPGQAHDGTCVEAPAGWQFRQMDELKALLSVPL